MPRTAAYAFLVAHGLHAKRFLDLGIPGTTLNAGYDSELTSALSIRPFLCTVFFGVNDLRAGIPRDAFLRDLLDLLATLRQAHARVVVVGFPDLTRVPAVARSRLPNLHRIVARWNDGMLKVALRTGAHFLDLRQYSRELATHPDYVSADGLHPSNVGYARLAHIILALIQQDHLWRLR